MSRVYGSLSRKKHAAKKLPTHKNSVARAWKEFQVASCFICYLSILFNLFLFKDRQKYKRSEFTRKVSVCSLSGVLLLFCNALFCSRFGSPSLLFLSLPFPSLYLCLSNDVLYSVLCHSFQHSNSVLYSVLCPILLHCTLIS